MIEYVQLKQDMYNQSTSLPGYSQNCSTATFFTGRERYHFGLLPPASCFMRFIRCHVSDRKKCIISAKFMLGCSSLYISLCCSNKAVSFGCLNMLGITLRLRPKASLSFSPHILPHDLRQLAGQRPRIPSTGVYFFPRQAIPAGHLVQLVKISYYFYL
jgi:hypothetical protein